MSEAIQAELARVLPGAVLGLLPITLTTFFDWQEKRDVAQKRNQAIDIAHKRVIFLNDFIKAQEGCMPERLGQIKQEVSSELSQLRHDLGKVLAIQEQRKEIKSAMRARIGFLQNLFLAYIPRGAYAWMLHIFYYMLLSVFLVGVFTGGYGSGNPSVWDWSAFRDMLLGMSIFFIPPMALIHWLARLAYRRSRRISEEIASSIRGT